MSTYAAPHVTMAVFLTLDANDEQDGQRYVVTDDGYAEWEAVGPDGARTWVRIGNPGIPEGGVAGNVIVKQSGTDFDVAWSTLSLDDLADVDLSTSPTDGQVLVWDAVGGEWVPEDQSGSGGGGLVPVANGDPDAPAYLFTPDGSGLFVEWP